MTPILILTHNTMELTKRCVESCLKQTVPTTVVVIDNGSSDGTGLWLNDILGTVGSISYAGNEGVSYGWNSGIEMFFDNEDYDHVVVVGSDTVLPDYFCQSLLCYDVPFVSGISVESMEELQPMPYAQPMVPHPDFSGFLMRRECWEKVGPFNESLVNYCGDCDYHVRAHRLGIPLWKANVPFYHERSSTMRLAKPGDRRKLELQADADREEFRKIYGCLPGTPEYARLFE
jgi:GT2 family glycosyltransferase